MTDRTICCASAESVGRSRPKGDLRRLGGAVDVHQTVDADVVSLERLSQLEVGERHTVERIAGLEIERRCKGVATEGDGRTRLELEATLDDILNGDVVATFIHIIVAIHLERTLVEPVGSDHAIAPQRDVVARSRIHQDAEREVGIRLTRKLMRMSDGTSISLSRESLAASHSPPPWRTV